MPKFFVNWQKRRQARRELHSLSDRELNDIGINRVDIERIVSEMVF